MVHFLRRFLFGTMLTGLAVVPGLAQEEPVESPAAGISELPPAAAADEIKPYQVRVSDAEHMAGRLRVVDAVTGEVRPVRKTGLLIVENGKVVGRSETGAGGVAQIDSLPVGSYSVVAIGPDGMAAFGFEVLPAALGVTVSTYRFDTLIAPSGDIAIGQQTIYGARAAGPAAPIPAGAVPAGPAPIGPTPSGPVIEVPVSLQDPIRGDAAYQDVVESAPLKGQSIVVRDGESVTGRLLVLDPKTGKSVGMMDARVLFIRGGQVLHNVETDSEGHLNVAGLDDGYYSMIGVGVNGFIAMGVHVETVSSDATVATGKTSDEQVSLLQPPPPPPVDFGAAGAGADAMGFAPGFGPPGTVVEEVIVEPVPAPGGYAGFGGGGGFGGAGGGGGLFGGGGLIGALVGAGVGAAIGAAVADDDDDDGDVGPPASPASP